ncbi:hypothetical protein LSH36_75g11027 [Paralvinella palmiformis]|uniref:U4/U6.U5 small nuclear ribonucleoprotein 27 kDa protein n=1 Tax=Paralvinella palmiformis TaxID=53620 RepID=A0AAD9K2H0_9ANNE|nr:hypothetical protein LSH36_75g11027 [Paralvinella palmiformis]
MGSAKTRPSCQIVNAEDHVPGIEKDEFVTEEVTQDHPTEEGQGRSHLTEGGQGPSHHTEEGQGRSPIARTRSSSPGYEGSPDGISKRSGKDVDSQPEINEEELAGLDPDEAEMLKMMGFAGFTSTKVVQFPDLIYWQYMNRRGGFNRPLDFIA